jgi:hypothetical protein
VATPPPYPRNPGRGDELGRERSLVPLQNGPLLQDNEAKAVYPDLDRDQPPGCTPAEGDTAMPEHTGSDPKPSTVVWETLEDTLRDHVQSWLQDLLEEEVTSFLGRLKS